MINSYTKELELCPSICDFEGKLGYADAFTVFMDMAASHAELIGAGFDAMAKRELFWLTVKTQVNFIKRPRIMDKVSVETWVAGNSAMRSVRCYEMRKGDEVLVTGKTEWAVINFKTGKLTPMAGIYPEGLNSPRETSCPEPFVRIPDRFDGAPVFAQYRVRSTDIDVGGHMNNAAYVRALLGAFSNKEISAREINRISVIFRTPCYEGETLSFAKTDTDGGLNVRAARGEDTVLLARVE